MCRTLVYLGKPTLIDDFLYQPDSSLVRRSYEPQQLHMLNLVGFGMMAWLPESSVVLRFERSKYEELAWEKHLIAAKLLGATLYEILARLVRANRLLATTHVAASMGLLGG